MAYGGMTLIEAITQQLCLDAPWVACTPTTWVLTLHALADPGLLESGTDSDAQDRMSGPPADIPVALHWVTIHMGGGQLVVIYAISVPPGTRLLLDPAGQPGTQLLRQPLHDLDSFQ